MAYDSINASGYNRMGLTITNDTGLYNAEQGGDLMGATVIHIPENSYREWVQFLGPGGVPMSYPVPMVAFP